MRRPDPPNWEAFKRLCDANPDILAAMDRGDGLEVVKLCESTGQDPLRLLRALDRAGGWEFAAWDPIVSTTRQVMAITGRFNGYRGHAYDKDGHWYGPLHLGIEAAIARVGRRLLAHVPLSPDGLSQDTVCRAVEDAERLVVAALAGLGDRFYRAVADCNQHLTVPLNPVAVLDIARTIPGMSPPQRARVAALADWPIRNARRRRHAATRRAQARPLAVL
ncbi:MAG TPA: hypothetical protein VKV21_14000 [Solirubrobacteraceae bacterium]|nr:hypothetical protein [Solirubrobacteraceae bacterium]